MKNKAFTLIELLVVVAIIGILAAVGVTTFGGFQDKAKISKQNLRKFEDIFLGVGADVLSFMSSALTVNPDKALRTMKSELDKTVKAVQKSGDVKKIEKLRMELERLAAVGGKDKIVPNEGIVFTYKGGTYKLTGTFASLNQILGLMYF